MERRLVVNEIQALVDGLAERLGRPVGVDDRRFRAIAYSSHSDEIDSVRRTSILGREAPQAVRGWLEDLGVLRAERALRVPENTELGMVARVCVPVRFRGRLLGLLWLVEPEPPFDEDQLALCQECATALADELYRAERQDDVERQREADAVRRLLDATEGDAGAAGIAADAAYAVLIVEAVFPAEHAGAAGIDLRLMEAVDRARRLVPPKHQLAAVQGTRATVVVAAPGAAEIGRYAAELLHGVQEALADAAGDGAIVGVSDAVTSVAELPGARDHAALCVQMGRSMPDRDRLVSWEELGAMRLIAELVGARDPRTLVPGPLRKLLGEPDADTLVRTLEAYLEHAGDVAGAATELYVHRSSLYNRLRRIEELIGVDLRSGSDRLELHLGVRLWRMGGTQAPPDVV